MVLNKITSLLRKEEKPTIREYFLSNLKYLIFLVLTILMLRYYPLIRLPRMELVVLVGVLTTSMILLDKLSPSKKIMC